jgi:4-oxalocrotonate tautomerase
MRYALCDLTWPHTPGLQGAVMPYVNIKVTEEGVTAGQKTELIQGVTELLAKVLGKNPATTVVVIDEVHTDNWGIGGKTVTVRRQRGQ